MSYRVVLILLFLCGCGASPVTDTNKEPAWVTEYATPRVGPDGWTWAVGRAEINGGRGIGKAKWRASSKAFKTLKCARGMGKRGEIYQTKTHVYALAAAKCPKRQTPKQ